MRLSARNQLKGKIVAVDRGVTTTHVKIDVGEAVITASITRTSAEELNLAVGKPAVAIIKASDVIVGIE
jgi:molybdopterin-binding protein